MAMHESYTELFDRIESNSGLVFVNTFEETKLIRELTKEFKNETIQFWSATQGLHQLDPESSKVEPYTFNPDNAKKNTKGAPTVGNILTALDVVESECKDKIDSSTEEFKRTVYILRDADKFFNNPLVIRKIRDIVYLCATAGSPIIITGPAMKVPTELEKDSVYIELGLPTRDEIKENIITKSIQKLIKLHNKEVLDDKDKIEENFDMNKIVNACMGLTEDEIFNACNYSLETKKALDEDVIIQEKKNIINKNDILKFWPCDGALDTVGGFDNFKAWFKVQKAVLDNPEIAISYHAEPPKGCLLLGVQGSGKGQPLHYPVMTETGWTKIGDLNIGDKIVSPYGKLEIVDGIFDKGIKPTYEITFADGRKTECCEDHLWKIYNKNFKTYKDSKDGWIICDTNKLIKYINNKSDTRKFYIPLVNDIIIPNVDLTIDPYVFGILIGDGNLTQGSVEFTNSEKDIINKVKDIIEIDNEYYLYSTIDKTTMNHRISKKSANQNNSNKYKNYLISKGLYGCYSFEKFIPEEYKNASKEQKIKLMQGLMDSDGSVNNSLSYSTTSKQLANDIVDIIRSIGGIAFYSTRTTKYTYNNEIKNGKESYRINIRYSNPTKLVSSEKHLNKISDNYQYSDLKLEIINIKRVEDQEIRCISIASDDHLYITNDFIVTHNTAIAKAAAKEWGKGVIKLDMGNVFAGLVGESEKRMRLALATAEAAGGVIIIDEIDKGLAGAGSSDKTDGGTTKRVIGTLLTWMQEAHPGVFVIATANDITAIRNSHPELLRKGRFDNIFFSDIPTLEEREAIFGIHLKKRNRDVSKFDIAELAKIKYKDETGKEFEYTGAEIEHSVKEAIQYNLAKNLNDGIKIEVNGKNDITTADIADRIKDIIPIVKVGDKHIQTMRDWARSNAVNVSTVAAIAKETKDKNKSTKTKSINLKSSDLNLD